MSVTITEAVPDGLPPVADVVAAIRSGLEQDMDRDAIDRQLLTAYPGLDALTGVQGAADWLGLEPRSIYSERARKRADGTPRWPEPDRTISRSPFWTWRTLAWHAATMPQGHRPKNAQ